MVILLKILNEFRSYMLEEKFEFRFVDNKLDIINYKSINHFDSNKIIINHENGSIVVNGKNLIVSRLLNNEIMIKGNFNSIEIR